MDRRVRDLIGVILVIVAVGGFAVAWSWGPQQDEGWVRALVIAGVPNLVIALLVYLAISFTLERWGMSSTDRLREEIATRVASAVSERVQGVDASFARVEDVPWRLLLASSQQVDLVAWFADSVLLDAQDEIEIFFRNGGTLRAVMLDLESAQTTNVAARQRRSAPISFRTHSTIEQLNRAAVASGAKPEQFTLFKAVDVLHYSGFRFDDTLILAPYEHYFSVPNRVPELQIDIRAAQDFRRFWMSEMAGFCESNNRVVDVQEYLERTRQLAGRG